MRVVALEEHFQDPELIAKIGKDRAAARGWPDGDAHPEASMRDQLAEVGAKRLADMDAAGVTLQVLSASGPGADLMPPDAGPDIACAYNDRLKRIVADHPERPFSPNKAGVDFLKALPCSPGDRAKIAHGNADKLLKLKPA